MDEAGHVTIHYRGGEADEGELGYKVASSALLAFGDLIGVLAAIEYGDSSQVDTKIRRIAPGGSIHFDFLLAAVAVAQATHGLLAGPATPLQLWNLLKHSVSAFKFLQGKPATAMRRIDSGFALTNINGDVQNYTQNVTLVVNSANAGDALENLIKRPIESAGVTQAEIENAADEESVVVQKEEAQCFQDVSSDVQVIEGVSERALMVESAVFRERNKWAFFDGQSRFKASIADDNFIARVNSGEPFAKGDVLICDVHTSQRIKKGKLLTENVILRVKDHMRRATQFGSLLPAD